MIFKVFYQEIATEAIVRERTRVAYVEGDSEKDVRSKLTPFNYNIEFVQKLAGAHLEYEKQGENFRIMENV